MRIRFGIVLVLLAACVIAMSGMGGKRQSGPFHVTVVSMEEASGTTAYKGESNHVLRVSFQMPTTAVTTGSTGVLATTGSTCGCCCEVLNDEPTGTGTATGTTTTAGLTATGGSLTTGGGVTYSVVTQSYIFAVDEASYATGTRFTDDSVSESPTEETIYLTNTGGGKLPSSGIDVEALGVNPGDTCTLRISPASRTVTTYLIQVTQIEKTTSCTTTYATLYATDVKPYAVSRSSADAVSIDSRKAFGQPDLGGALPGDANAPAAPVNFYGWTYKGGLFAGNADFLSANDLSGTARSEFYASSAASSAEFQTLTLLGLAPASQFTTTPALTAYLVSSGPTSLTGETWAGAWPITGPASNSLTFDGSSQPYNEYANFEFSDGGAQWVSVACTGESSVISASTSMWEYFANSAYISGLTSLSSSLTSSVPLSDPLPRVWQASPTSNSLDYYVDSYGF